MEKSREKIEEEIKELWVEMGRDEATLKLKTKTIEELTTGLTKLKAIKMSFKILFSEEGNHKLAIHLLAEVFLKHEDEQEHGIKEGS